MYESKNVAQLKSLCKDRKIAGYSKLRKAGLVAALETSDREAAAKAQPKAEAAPIVTAPPVVVKGRSVGATTMAAQAPQRHRFTKYPNTTARNRAKANRRAIRASGGQA